MLGPVLSPLGPPLRTPLCYPLVVVYLSSEVMLDAIEIDVIPLEAMATCKRIIVVRTASISHNMHLISSHQICIHPNDCLSFTAWVHTHCMGSHSLHGFTLTGWVRMHSLVGLAVSDSMMPVTLTLNSPLEVRLETDTCGFMGSEWGC